MLSRRIKDIAGQRFGRLTALSYAGSDKSGNARWNCRCDCGVEKTVLGQGLRSGAVVSCKCYANELAAQNKLTHGLSATPYYKAWFGMIQRCENINHAKWKRYGARGIKVCDRWLEFSGLRMTASQWAIHQQIPRHTIYNRLRAGLPVEKVLAPIQRK